MSVGGLCVQVRGFAGCTGGCARKFADCVACVYVWGCCRLLVCSVCVCMRGITGGGCVWGVPVPPTCPV